MRRPISFKELIKNDKQLKEVLDFYCKKGDYVTMFEVILGKIIATVVEQNKPVNLGLFILESYRQKWKSGIVGEEIESIVLRLRTTKAFKEYAKEILANQSAEEDENGTEKAE